MLSCVSDSATQSHPLILFDGACKLCNASVQWILRRDHACKFRFASLQSTVAKAELARIGLNCPDADSLVLVHDGRHYLRTNAVLRIAMLLGIPWSVFVVFFLIPACVRDPVYRLVARNRYRWFGKRESCMVPAKEARARFLDAEDQTS